MTATEVQDRIVEILKQKQTVQTWFLCRDIPVQKRQVYSALQTLKRKGIIVNKRPGPKAALWELV